MGPLHVIFLCLVSFGVGQVKIEIKKCCQNNQLLDTKNVQCVEGNAALSDESLVAVDVTSGSDVDAGLIVTGNEFLTCYAAGHEVIKLGGEDSAVLTTEGTLIVSKYANGTVKQEKFCIDRNKENEVVALICNLCRQGYTCLQLCCPYGYSIIENPDYDYDNNPDAPGAICNKNSSINFDLTAFQILNKHTQKVLNVNENENIKFVAPRPEELNSLNGMQWNCPEETIVLDHDLVINGIPGQIPPHGDFQMLFDGSLKGNIWLFDYEYDDSEFEYLEENVYNITEVYWSQGEYCIAFDEVDETPIYHICNQGHDAEGKSFDKSSWCQMYESYIYPVVISISIIFLIITIFVYLIEDSLKKQKLFSRIVMGYLINLAISYILTAVESTKKNARNDQATIGCVFRGYLAQYFFLAYFFWLNVGSFNIWNKLTNFKHNHMGEDKRFLKYFAYAQGMPLIVSFITICVDNIDPDSVPDLQQPNMGQLGCFLGYGENKDRPSFFATSYFLYFYLYLILILTANTVFLVLTLIKLREGFKNIEDDIKSQGRNETPEEVKRRLWGQFMTVARISILMGVFWVFELISIALTVEYDENDFCYVKFILDTPALCTGLILFLFTVAKKPVYRGMKQKASGLFTSESETTKNRTKSTNNLSVSVKTA